MTHYLYLHQIELERQGQSGGKVQGGNSWPIKPEEDCFIPVSKKCPWHNVCSLWKRELHRDACLPTSHIIVLGPEMSEAAIYLACPTIKRKTDQEVSLEASDPEKLQILNDLRDAIFQAASQLLLDIEHANSARKEQGQGHVFSEVQEDAWDHWGNALSEMHESHKLYEAGRCPGGDVTLPKIFGEASRDRQRLIFELARRWKSSLEDPRAIPREEPGDGGTRIFMEVLEYVQDLEYVRSPFHEADHTKGCLINNFRPIDRYPVVASLVPEYAAYIEDI